MIKTAKLRLVFCASIFLLLFFSCTPEEKILYRKSTILMDTLVTVTVTSDSREKAEEAINGAFGKIREFEKLINFWSPESEVSAINRKAGAGAVRVSALTIDVVEKALYVSEKTKGTFDATVGPVMRLYDFKKAIGPDEKLLKEKLLLVNYRDVIANRNDSSVFLRRKGMSFDTGGIAKGYAADIAVNFLKSRGIKGGIVAIAGDIRAFGTKPDGEPWVVGIRNPRPSGGEKEDEIMAVIGLSDEAVSTSGDYERYFIRDGMRHHHLIDPKTGRSAQGCRSVSIISKAGVLSDGFSTGIFVMGVEKGMRVARELGFEAIVVDGQGGLHMTDGIKGRVRLKAGYEGKMSNM